MVECYFLGYKAILAGGHCECGRIASGTQFQMSFKANVKKENNYDFYSTKNISKLILKDCKEKFQKDNPFKTLCSQIYCVITNPTEMCIKSVPYFN